MVVGSGGNLHAATKRQREWLMLAATTNTWYQYNSHNANYLHK